MGQVLVTWNVEPAPGLIFLSAGFALMQVMVALDSEIEGI